MPDWLLLVAATLASGAVAGVLAGLFGIGGGVIIVPVLEFVLGLLGVDAAIRMHVAVATSLATIIPTSIASARAHRQRDAVNVDIVRRWSGFVLGGSVLGVLIADRLHGQHLALVFATLALLVALKMVFFPGSRNLANDIPRRAWVPLIPTAIGASSSMMGIGGGTFSVMTLTLFNEPVHRAVGTAALLGLVISVPGTAAFVAAGWGDPRLPTGSIGYLNLIAFACIAPATVLAAPVGARIAHAFRPRVLTVAFGVFLLLAAVRMFAGTFL